MEEIVHSEPGGKALWNKFCSRTQYCDWQDFRKHKVNVITIFLREFYSEWVSWYAHTPWWQMAVKESATEISEYEELENYNWCMWTNAILGDQHNSSDHQDYASSQQFYPRRAVPKDQTTPKQTWISERSTQGWPTILPVNPNDPTRTTKQAVAKQAVATLFDTRSWPFDQCVEAIKICQKDPPQNEAWYAHVAESNKTYHTLTAKDPKAHDLKFLQDFLNWLYNNLGYSATQNSWTHGPHRSSSPAAQTTPTKHTHPRAAAPTKPDLPQKEWAGREE
jgi:hypothetical protein